MKTKDLIVGKTYEIQRYENKKLLYLEQKKFRFVGVFERLVNGFLVIDYIFKPIDLNKHDVLQPYQAERLGQPELAGCCRFASIDNFKPLTV